MAYALATLMGLLAWALTMHFWPDAPVWFRIASGLVCGIVAVRLMDRGQGR